MKVCRRWSIAALKELKPGLPARIMIDVLRQAARSCVVKREFQKAGLLIRQALYLAREVFDVDHPRYCDVLSDYGFYLLNYDSVANSVSVYQVRIAHCTISVVFILLQKDAMSKNTRLISVCANHTKINIRKVKFVCCYNTRGSRLRSLRSRV